MQYIKRKINMPRSASWSLLQKPVIESLLELSDCVVRIAFSDDESCFAAIGPHVRHSLDYYHAIKVGAGTGVIDYNVRRRGGAEERNAASALSDIANLLVWLRTEQIDEKPVQVLAEYGSVSQSIGEFSSSLMREMLHVIEHTVHHTAFIVSIAASRGISLDDQAGVAAATRSFRRRTLLN
mgnify:CR=1 FL=1